ncbi:unnamed protein product [Caenorhabditis auriculariae]|uniref:non-specific serine/threonine protein kinase n=1 Tax=Caenorhabditis auriculariae TaxID=2777116 RepID=A0A8S1H0N1_9PELO|nr:unnamed protein product [Caenorhabditis auriculariae]
MPATCRSTTRNCSTLPRPTSKRISMKKSNIPYLKRPTSVRQLEDGDSTPRASTFDVSEGTSRQADLRSEPVSMTSSIVENCGSESASPTEARDIVSDMNTRCRIGAKSTVLKAKRIRFYRNGDQYYKGMWYALRCDRVKTMQPLMEDLNKAMCDSTILTHGIRHIFTIDGSTRITDIDQFEDNCSYVCSSTDTFKNMDYAKAQEPSWRFTLTSTFNRYRDSSMALNSLGQANERTDFVFPRIITIIRNGVKPRRVVRHLLNKKTARSFDQVLTDLTDSVKLDSGAIRKLFGISGRQVLSLEDFFREDDVFIAYGNERTAADDFLVVSEECKRVPARYGRKQRKSFQQRHMPLRNESLRLDRSGSVVPDEQARHLPPSLEELFDVERLIGDGNTALVYEVIDKRFNDRRALKVIARENAYGKEALIESELRILQKISNDFIVQMFEYWPINGSFYMSLELIRDGDLFEHLRQVGRIEERQAARMIACVAEALRYLHECRIVHRDVKPENLLLLQDEHGELALKLADFGLACELQDDTPLTAICGTPTYVAPEVLTERGYNEKVDTWATGIILYVILCGFPPFQSMEGENSQAELFRQIATGDFSFPSPAWDGVSWAVRHLIICLVTVDPEERFSAQNVLENEWIKQFGEVEQEYETWAQFTVQSHVPNEDVEETDYEYFMSRRTSMDELSESGREEFVFQRSYS